MKKVWIPGLIKLRFWGFYFSFCSLVLFWLRRHIKHERQCFIGYPNLNFVKNAPLRVIFSSLFSVFGYPDEPLSLVFDILVETCCPRLKTIRRNKPFDLQEVSRILLFWGLAVRNTIWNFFPFNIPQLTTDQQDGDNLAFVEGNFAAIIWLCLFLCCSIL